MTPDELAARRASLEESLATQRRAVQDAVTAVRVAELNVARLEGALLLLDELAAPAADPPPEKG